MEEDDKGFIKFIIFAMVALFSVAVWVESSLDERVQLLENEPPTACNEECLEIQADMYEVTMLLHARIKMLERLIISAIPDKKEERYD